MIICITGWFDKYDHNGIKTGQKEFIVSHGIDMNTGRTVILPCEHPSKLGANLHPTYNEYVLET